MNTMDTNVGKTKRADIDIIFLSLVMRYYM